MSHRCCSSCLCLCGPGKDNGLYVDPCGRCVSVISVRMCTHAHMIVDASTESTFSFTTGWIHKQEREQPPSSESPGTMVPVLVLPLLQMSLITPTYFYRVYSP